MKIKITEKLRPFSREAGITLPVPGKKENVTVYPADYFTDGPVKNFTVKLDIEKARIEISGNGKRFFIDGEKKPFTRLSLGMNKKLDWMLVKRRMDLREILPVWFALGQMIPPTGHRVEIEEFEKLFLAGFSGIFGPAGEVESRLAIEIPEGDQWSYLTEGARCIGKLFYHEGRVLPKILFPCGRITDGAADLFDYDLEWTKKRPGRMILRAKREGEILLRFQSGTKSFRLNGKRIDVGTPIELTPGDTYQLDRFER